MIDAILKHKKMSRRQLAKAASIPPSSLQSAMERGKNISSDMLRKIANTLQVPVELLIDPERIIRIFQISPTFLNMLRENFHKTDKFENLSTDEQSELILQFLEKRPDAINPFKRDPSWETLENIPNTLGITLWELLESGASQTESPNETDKQKEKQHGDSEQAIRAPTDDDILKMNCTAVSSYMEKMNPVGQAVAVQTVKTLADMPEYQKKDEPAQK